MNPTAHERPSTWLDALELIDLGVARERALELASKERRRTEGEQPASVEAQGTPRARGIEEDTTS